MGKSKLFLVEDHELVRKGIRSIITQEKSLEIIAEFDRAQKAIDALDNNKIPDLILMDISMPEMNGLEAAKIIGAKFPKVQIIILSMYKDEEYVMEGLNFNISGYVVKDSVAEEIIVAINKVLSGGKYFSREVIDTAINSYREIKHEQKKKEEVQLTKRELEVLIDISNGLKNQEIAQRLFITEKTVEAHRGNVMKKLQARNMAELIKKAMTLGLLNI
ncbi:MAG: response regulator transcription factor [Bacteroidota bacterium]